MVSDFLPNDVLFAFFFCEMSPYMSLVVEYNLIYDFQRNNVAIPKVLSEWGRG